MKNRSFPNSFQVPADAIKSIVSETLRMYSSSFKTTKQQAGVGRVTNGEIQAEKR